MEKTKISERSELQFSEQMVVPYLPKGEDAKAILDEASKMLTKGQIWYDEERGICGSTSFAVAAIDTILRPIGIRVMNLQDASRPEVLAVIKNRFYADIPYLVVQSHHDFCDSNKKLLETIISLSEQKQGTVKFPFMVSGFTPVLDQNGSYGQTIITRHDFSVIADERLSEKNSGKSFDNVDERGIPIFDRKGKRTFYAKGNGLSGVYVDINLGINAGFGILPSSNGGMVVSVC